MVFRRTRSTSRGPWLVLAATVAGWLTLAPIEDRAAEAAVRPPRLPYEITTLANGLTVILSEDHSAPIVHVQIWYHVGSKDERPGRTGFAHLFEHLMFKGSRNVAAEAHASLVAGVGGQSNAYTTPDTTVFWETAPARYLPLLLWLEADRMATLRIDSATFAREREVVKEERRMRVENQPYGRLSEIIYDQAFTVHPYKHQPIGAVTDLDAASIDDVREFYRTYYVPDNAVLTIVGDFDTRQGMALVAQYFGRIPRPDRAAPRDVQVEPAITRERRVTLRQAWALPVVVVAHHIPRDGDPDSYALYMAAKILSDGRSSRIFRALSETGVALTAFAAANIVEDPSLFFAVAIVQPGHTTAHAESALVGEIDRLASDPVTPHELQRARNQYARDRIMGRETNQQKASQLAHAVVIHHDIATADGEFDRVMGITAADIQRAARRFLDRSSRLVLTILPLGQTQ